MTASITILLVMCAAAFVDIGAFQFPTEGRSSIGPNGASHAHLLPLRDDHISDAPHLIPSSDTPPVLPSRRHSLKGIVATVCGGSLWLTNPGKSLAVIQAESTELEIGLLESRVTENVLSPPTYDLEIPDIYYPSWFKGSWRVSSTTVGVQAPCGVALFGGNQTYQRAQNEVGTTLNYDSRFISYGNDDTIIADREYNVQSIAKAAMGQYSVVDIPLATPNKLSCILAPKGSPNMLRVDLLALNRRSETISDVKFDCSEVTREIVAPVNNNNNRQPTGAVLPAPSSSTILKEVETTSLYTFNPAKNEIQCQQRSATFLLPSQTSPMAYKMWEAARGRPIDVRFYNVRYTK